MTQAPETPGKGHRTTLIALGAILSALILVLGSLGGILALVGNTAWVGPLWLGGMVLAPTILALLTANHRPLVAFGSLVAFTAALVLWSRRHEGLSWPAELLIAQGPGVTLTLLLWLGLAGSAGVAALLRYRRRRPDLTSPDLRSWLAQALARKHLATTAAVAIGVPTLFWMAGQGAVTVVESIGWAVAREPAVRVVEVIDRRHVVRSGPRSSGQSRVYIDVRDAAGRDSTLSLEPFYQREVKTNHASSPARDRGMRKCWNQVYRPGDVLTLEGRDGPLGFAIDRMAAVQRDGRPLCTSDGRLNPV